MPTKLILVPSAEQAGDAGTGHSNKDCQAARPRAGAQALRGRGEGGGSGRTRRPSQSQNITDMGCPSLPTRAPLGRTQQVEAEGSSGGSRPRSQVPSVLSGFCWEPRSTRPQAGPPPPSSFRRLCPDDLLLGQSAGLPPAEPVAICWRWCWTQGGTRAGGGGEQAQVQPSMVPGRKCSMSKTGTDTGCGNCREAGRAPWRRRRSSRHSSAGRTGFQGVKTELGRQRLSLRAWRLGLCQGLSGPLHATGRFERGGLNCGPKICALKL